MKKQTNKKPNKYHTVGSVPKSNSKMVEKVTKLIIIIINIFSTGSRTYTP